MNTSDPNLLRDFLAILAAATLFGILAARVWLWWDTRHTPLTPHGEPPIGDQVWRVLAEARQITIDAAEERGL